MKPGNKVKRIEGVLAPVITPFRKDYSPDAAAKALFGLPDA